MIIKYTLLFLFLSFFSRSVTITDTLWNKNPHIELQNFQSEPYRDMDYDALVEAEQSIISDSSIAREHVLEQLFPEVPRSFCGDGFCQTKMYELVNFNISQERMRRLPTVLLFAGVHGGESLGVNVLVQLTRLFQKLYMVRKKWYRILNNVRLLVVPCLNKAKFYESEDLDQTVFLGKRADFDPWEDFNLGTDGTCFHGVGSQFLYRIFQENLVYGSLAFTKGDFGIDFPNLNEVTSSADVTLDDGIFNLLAQKLGFVFNFHRADAVPEMTVVDPIETDQIRRAKSGTPRRGNFLEWAYAGSLLAKKLQTSCFMSGSGFARAYQHPHANSNRAFAMEVKLDKELIRGDPARSMGNELYLVSREHDDAEPGMISAGVLLATQFLEYMKPFVSLTSVTVRRESGSFDKQLVVDFRLIVSGCLDYHSLRLTSPPVSRLEAFEANDKIWHTRQVTATVSAVFEHEQMLKATREQSFQFKVDCDDRFQRHVIQSKPPISIFVALQFSPEVKIVKDLFSLQNQYFGDYSIEKLILGQLRGYLVYEKSAKRSLMVRNKSVLVSLGNYFPISLSYDPETTSVGFSVLDDNIPAKARAIKVPSYSVETGIINLYEDFADNPRTEQFLQSLKTAPSIDLNIYLNLRSYVCSNLRISKIENKHRDIDQVAALLEANNAALQAQNDKKGPDKAVLASLNQEHAELTKKQRLLQNADPCFAYHSLAASQELKQYYFLSLSGDQRRHILPTIFLNMLGHSVKVTLEEPAPTAPSGSNLLSETKKQLESPPRRVMNGKVVRVDKDVTGDMDRRLTPPTIPDFATFAALPVNAGVASIKAGLFCSSLNPVFPVLDESLERFQAGRTADTGSLKDFSSIFVMNPPDSQNEANIIVYTTYKTAGTLTLYNKSQTFVLRKMDKVIDLQGEYAKYKNDVSFFQGTFDMSNVALSYMFVRVRDEKRAATVFECFLNYANLDFDVKNLYILHRDIQASAHELVHRERNYPGIPYMILVIVSGLVLVAGITYLVRKRKSKPGQLIEA